MRMALIFKGLTAAIVLGLTVQTSALEADENAQTMSQAARSLKFLEHGNSAYMLEKQNIVLAKPSGVVHGVAPVAVIFGYADNRSACQQIAEIPIASREAGSFKSHPIY